MKLLRAITSINPTRCFRLAYVGNKIGGERSRIRNGRVCRERERDEERGREEHVEGTGRDVSRCKPGDDVDRREPRRARGLVSYRIVSLEVSDLVPTDRHYSRVRYVVAHRPLRRHVYERR